ncbi:response regulator [Halostella sp. PRR32]|uniref:response regulator transcription factor n=1 Tax=Halostella sp. PRR32 TaxID=3098147 RepID=UPI002B1E2377|nr:response regulator [Halostella sp. PRR32]
MPDLATVLVVEDNDSLASLYASYLDDEYAVRTASDEAEARELMGPEVDIVLLDRKLPNTSGEEVLYWMQNRNYHAHVAMVTAVDPDFDIVELPVDDYVVKPVTSEELIRTVERFRTRGEYDERQRELSAKLVRRNVLTVEKTAAELENSEEFQRLEARIDALREEVASLEESLAVEGVQTPSEPSVRTHD